MALMNLLIEALEKEGPGELVSPMVRYDASCCPSGEQNTPTLSEASCRVCRASVFC